MIAAPLFVFRHCDERSDDAIQSLLVAFLDCFAPLAMTTERSTATPAAPANS